MPDTNINNYSTPAGGSQVSNEPPPAIGFEPSTSFETGHSTVSEISPSEQKQLGEMAAEAGLPVLPQPNSSVSSDSVAYLLAKSEHKAASAILDNMAKSVEETKERMREHLNSNSYQLWLHDNSPVVRRIEDELKGVGGPDALQMGIWKSPEYGAWMNQLPPSEKADRLKVQDDYTVTVGVQGKMQSLAGAGLSALITPAADIVVNVTATGAPVTNAQVPNMIEPSSAAFHSAEASMAAAIPPDIGEAIVAYAGMFMAPPYNLAIEQSARETPKGEPVKDLKFAQKFAQNLLAMAIDPEMKSRMETIFGEKGAAIFKIVMLSMGVAFMYRTETDSKATREEFQAGLENRMTSVPKDDIRNKLLAEIGKQLGILKDDDLVSKLKEKILDYLGSGPKLDDLLNPIKLLNETQELTSRGDISSS